MIKRLKTCLTVVLLCMLFTACGMSCAFSSKTNPKPEKVQVREQTQMVDIGMQSHKEYVVRERIDLQGRQVNVPEGVTITFKKGGSIVNGTLNGNGTKLNSKTDEVLSVKLKGTWCVDRINDLVFSKEYLTDTDIINNLNAIQSDDIANEVTINRDYYIAIAKSGGAGLLPSCHSTILLKGTISLEGNDYKTYQIIDIKKKEDVTIKGGSIVGDVGKHTYIDGTTSEWGMGVNIDESCNVSVVGVRITKCTGDGIYITGGNEQAICMYNHAPRNVLIKNVICDDNRRQGLSIIHVDGLEIIKSSFINTGKTEYTGPGSGIDFEPNVDNGRNMSIRNVSINKCQLYGNKGKQQGGYNAFYDGTRSSFENITIKDTYYGGMCYIPGDMDFDHCEFESVTVRNSEMPVHTTFTNCTISKGEGVCIVIQKPTIQYKEYERNRDYSIVFDNCNISINEKYYNEKFNGLFYYKGNNNIYDGGMLLRNSTVTLPQGLHPDMHLFCRLITGNVRFENSTINAIGRPLDLAGATYTDCIINCDFVLLNTVRRGKDVLRNCNVNTTSERQILYLGDYGFTGDGYEIENCFFTNRKAAAFSRNKKAQMRAEPIVKGNRFQNETTIIE